MTQGKTESEKLPLSPQLLLTGDLPNLHFFLLGFFLFFCFFKSIHLLKQFLFFFFLRLLLFFVFWVFLNFIYLFIYLWLCWVFVSVRGLFPVAASGGHSSSRCAGLSLLRPLLLQSTGSRRAGSVVVAHGLSCSAACGIFPDQGSNPCPLHWQADSQPLRHQGSPKQFLKVFSFEHLFIYLSRRSYLSIIQGNGFRYLFRSTC